MTVWPPEGLLVVRIVAAPEALIEAAADTATPLRPGRLPPGQPDMSRLQILPANGGGRLLADRPLLVGSTGLGCDVTTTEAPSTGIRYLYGAHGAIATTTTMPDCRHDPDHGPHRLMPKIISSAGGLRNGDGQRTLPRLAFESE